MGKKTDLTDGEKSDIARSLSEGCSTLDISKLLGRDHRTIKHFVESCRTGRKKRVERKRRKLSDKDLRRIERESAKDKLASSAVIFKRCDLPGVPKTTRCSVLKEIDRMRLKKEARRGVSRKERLKGLDGAGDSAKTGFPKVLWTDEAEGPQMDQMDGLTLIDADGNASQ